MLRSPDAASGKSDKRAGTSAWLTEVPLWAALTVWAFLPATMTPRVDVFGVPIGIKDLILLALAAYYGVLRVLPAPSTVGPGWNRRVATAMLLLCLYGIVSVRWSPMSPLERPSMLLTMVLSGAAAWTAFAAVAHASADRAHGLLRRMTYAVAIIGGLYFAESFLELGLRQHGSPLGLSAFGIERVRGPLFGASTGYFVLVPALGFIAQRVLDSRRAALSDLLSLFSVSATLVALGSRAGLIVFGAFVLIAAVTGHLTRHRLTSLLLLASVIWGAGALVFTRATSQRLQDLEDEARARTHETAWALIAGENWGSRIAGTGLGSQWTWYLTDIDGVPTNMINTVAGASLYHPHSTALFAAVELGLPGVGFLLLLAWALVWCVWRHRTLDRLPVFAAALPATALGMLFDFFLFKSFILSCVNWIFVFGCLRLAESAWGPPRAGPPPHVVRLVHTS